MVLLVVVAVVLELLDKDINVHLKVLLHLKAQDLMHPYMVKLVMVGKERNHH
jgi:hypothetical protein|tara:strand:+ start:154 stop:309 length:156 start_codon:yes stop_codon:yes gene_type:complete